VWYLLSIVLAAAGLVLLVVLAIVTVRGLRRFTSTMSMVLARTHDRAGLLRARSAGVRVAIDQRRRTPDNQ
jgi:hypothetical protein